MKNNKMHAQSALTSGLRTAGPVSSAISGAASAADPAQLASAEFQGSELALELLTRMFQRYPGRLNLRLWNGTAFTVGAGSAGGAVLPFTLVFNDPEVVSSAVLKHDPLVLAESYFRGDLLIEGDFFAALGIKDHLDTLQMSAGEQVRAAVLAMRLRMRNAAARKARQAAALSQAPSVKAHSRAENREAIHFHYDVSNEFYSLWLDRAMVYSCAYFESAEVDLDSAQQAKLEHICRKLSLEPGEKFLDIGCGWGALVIYAAQHYGVRAHGVTLSPQQLNVARERISAAGLGERVTVELMDYRDLPGESLYDKVASVGMFEHVGLKNLPVYFGTVHRLLKPRGLFLNHGITHDSEGWERNLSTEFINRYVFPDGQLDTIGNIQRFMERAKFEIADVEGLRAHYAMTLRHWVARLERNKARALEYVNETTYRVWQMYMAAAALDFELGKIGIYQVLASKRGTGVPDLPLTRRHLYS
jgi:cyclopropane-fatty-acyl-phospholipid synthase